MRVATNIHREAIQRKTRKAKRPKAAADTTALADAARAPGASTASPKAKLDPPPTPPSASPSPASWPATSPPPSAASTPLPPVSERLEHAKSPPDTSPNKEETGTASEKIDVEAEQEGRPPAVASASQSPPVAAEAEQQAALDAKQVGELEEEEKEQRRQWEEEDAEEQAAWGATRRVPEVLEAEPELSKKEMLRLLETQYDQALKQVCRSTTRIARVVW